MTKFFLIFLLVSMMASCVSLKKHKVALAEHNARLHDAARNIWTDGRDKGIRYGRRKTAKKMGAERKKMNESLQKYYKAWRRCELAGPAYQEK